MTGGVLCVPTPAREAGMEQEKSPEEDVAAEFQFDVGAYLLYEPKDLGMLSLVWSKTPVTGAIAYFEPVKKVPAFKFSVNEGRTLLKRGADEKTKFFQGWAEFIREGINNYWCKKIYILPHQKDKGPPHKVQIVKLEKDTNVVCHLYAGQWWDLTPESCQAICIVHPDCEEFDVGTHAPSTFMEIGRNRGTAFEVQVTNSATSPKSTSSPESTSWPKPSLASKPTLGSKSTMDTIVNSGEPREPGAYLVYQHANNGTLFLVWSEQAVPDALAYFQPTKPVQKFKYRQSGGKYELKRECDDRRNFLIAWSAFLKEGLVQYASTRVYIFTPTSTEREVLLVWLERQTNNVHQVRPGNWWEMDPANVDQVVVIHPDVTEFEVTTMAPNLFSQKGGSFGSVFEVRR